MLDDPVAQCRDVLGPHRGRQLHQRLLDAILVGAGHRRRQRLDRVAERARLIGTDVAVRELPRDLRPHRFELLARLRDPAREPLAQVQPLAHLAGGDPELACQQRRRRTVPVRRAVAQPVVGGQQIRAGLLHTAAGDLESPQRREHLSRSQGPARTGPTAHIGGLIHELDDVCRTTDERLTIRIGERQRVGLVLDRSIRLLCDRHGHPLRLSAPLRHPAAWTTAAHDPDHRVIECVIEQFNRTSTLTPEI